MRPSRSAAARSVPGELGQLERGGADGEAAERAGRRGSTAPLPAPLTAPSRSHPRVSCPLFHPQTGVYGTTRRRPCPRHARLRRALTGGSLQRPSPGSGAPARQRKPEPTSLAQPPQPQGAPSLSLPPGEARPAGRGSRDARPLAAGDESRPRGRERRSSAAPPHARPERWAKPSPTV